MLRFQEFGIDENIKVATNGVDIDGYILVPGSSTDTTTSRYLRITRVGNIFSFYTKTNQTDAWSFHGSLTRERPGRCADAGWNRRCDVRLQHALDLLH